MINNYPKKTTQTRQKKPLFSFKLIMIKIEMDSQIIFHFKMYKKIARMDKLNLLLFYKIVFIITCVTESMQFSIKLHWRMWLCMESIDITSVIQMT